MKDMGTKAERERLVCDVVRSGVHVLDDGIMHVILFGITRTPEEYVRLRRVAADELEGRMEAGRQGASIPAVPGAKPVGIWSGHPDPDDPDNYWIDDQTGERVCAKTGERTPA